MTKKGCWIWQTNRRPEGKEAVYFRRTFAYDGCGSVTVKISASNRYKLWVNGSFICRGPQKGDRFCQYYDTLDIIPWLKPGENVIAALVQHYSEDYHGCVDFKTGPVSVIPGSRGGLYVDCDSLDISTDCRWKCLRDVACAFVEADQSKYAGDMEQFDGTMYPQGWKSIGFDDSMWTPAAELCPAETHRMGGVLYQWQLTPRTLPMLYEKTILPVGISKMQGMEFAPLLQGKAVTVPQGTCAWMDIDMGELVNAYISLQVNAGAGNMLTLEYAESYLDPQGRKAIRDDAANGIIRGEQDVYITGNGAQHYEPFHFRVFRFLRLHIDAKASDVTVSMPDFKLMGYPLEPVGRFKAADPRLEKMWDISLRTLQRCALDTYVDCPYYEQMQYIMDTVIEALQTFQITADDRLVRRALEDFHATRRPDGMIQCNAPAAFTQIIPVFALYYVDLLYYHYMYYGDRMLLKRYLPTVSGILGYFLERMDPETGLLGPTGYWSFVDWVDLWRENHGSPVSDPEEPLYMYSHVLAYALERTAWLYEQIGWTDAAKEYESIRQSLLYRLRSQTQAHSGYWRISPSETVPSQHAQLWAVLSGCAEGEEAKKLMRRCMTDGNLLQCSYSMSFYLFRAMEKAGVYDEITHKWQPWHTMMELHMTTWAEDGVNQRSDCHGWSSIPIYDLTAMALGLRPEKPGYEAVCIRPGALELGNMEADIATVKGPIHICRQVQKQKDGYGVSLNITLPEAIPVNLYTHGSKCVSFCQRDIAFDYTIHYEGEYQQ